MTRADVLALASALGLDALMTSAQRTLADDPAGYGPVLDAVFYLHGRMLGLTATPTDIDDGYAYCVGSLLRAVVWDIVMPATAREADFSVDAPLTSVKYSQLYRQAASERERAWDDAAICGYDQRSNVGGFKLNLDFLEPGGVPGREYG